MSRIISGKNVALTFINHLPDQIQLLSVFQGKNRDILKLAAKRGVPTEIVSQPLTQEKRGVHQNIWIRCNDYPYCDLEDLYCLKTVVVLDQMSDPHNFGAMARTAHQLGIDAFVIQDRNAVSVTPVVTQISTGGVELLKVAVTNNLRRALEQLRKNGFWVYGLDMKGEPIQTTTFNHKRVIVMGSEGGGIRPLLQRSCDQLVSIPMSGKLDSLNVSNAFAIVAWTLFSTE